MTKKLIRAAVALLLLLTASAGLWIWDAAFRTPVAEPQALPTQIISLHSIEGQRLLAAANFRSDYPVLMVHFESQQRPAYCGVASSVMVLNALQSAMPRTQDSFFTPAASSVRSKLQVTFGGMTLTQLGDLLRAHGLDLSMTHAADGTVAAFRQQLRDNLLQPNDFLLINYQRESVGQARSGHISPVAAYDETSDRVLVLDVAAHKYPPSWIALSSLWQAMNTVDDASGRTRGYLVVRNGSR